MGMLKAYMHGCEWNWRIRIHLHYTDDDSSGFKWMKCVTYFRFSLFCSCYVILFSQHSTVSVDLCTTTTESQQFNIVATRYWTIGLLSEGEFAGKYEICWCAQGERNQISGKTLCHLTFIWGTKCKKIGSARVS